VDVKTALLKAKVDKGMYIKLPEGAVKGDADTACRLDLDVYETKQSGRQWGIKLDKEPKTIGAVLWKVDPCLYTWSHPVHGLVYSLVHVDDLIVAAASIAGVQAVKKSVSATFDVRDMGEVKDFIGMKVILLERHARRLCKPLLPQKQNQETR